MVNYIYIYICVCVCELYFEELDCKHVNYVLVYAIDILFVHM